MSDPILTTTCNLYKHGTELIDSVKIPDVFPNLPDILEVAGQFYKNASGGYEPPFTATYWLATIRRMQP